MRRNAHIKKILSESYELRVNSEKSSKKCNKMQHKKRTASKERTKRNRQFCNTNTGAGRMRREFMYTIRARQDRDDLLPGRGICAHDNARLSCCRSEFIYTDMRGGKIRHFRHPKRVSEHESAREVSAVFAVPKGCGLLPGMPLWRAVRTIDGLWSLWR